MHIRLYESSESEDPISQWSPEVSFDGAISNPRVYRQRKFHLGKRFSELEKFRFPEPIGPANVVLAAQDEVATLLQYNIPMRELDVKIGGNEIDRLRRWHKQGKLSKSRGMTSGRFPETSSPRKIAALIRRGILQNARFAASVIIRGVKYGAKEDQQLLIRSDATFQPFIRFAARDGSQPLWLMQPLMLPPCLCTIFPRNSTEYCPGNATPLDTQGGP